jgi:hypothetical protein
VVGQEHEVEIVHLSGCCDLGDRSGAVRVERMNMDDAREIVFRQVSQAALRLVDVHSIAAHPVALS